MVPTAEKLIERAESGVKLSKADRKHCVGYLMATSPEISNVEMGRLFKVTEKVIRTDRQEIREEKAKHIREEDIGLVIADIALSFENQVRDIEKSKNKSKQGERVYLEHCKAIFDIQLKKIKALQELGFYPRNLGNLTVQRYDYQAHVDRDGSVEVRPVDFELPKEIQQPDAVDAEFEYVKMLPAPTQGFSDFEQSIDT